MRLPQDRILHIDTEIVDGKINVTTEWQGELVRCKNCKHYLIDGFDATTGWCYEIKNSVYEDDYCSYGEYKGGNNE